MLDFSDRMKTFISIYTKIRNWQELTGALIQFKRMCDNGTDKIRDYVYSPI